MEIGGTIVVYGFEGYSISLAIIKRIGGLFGTTLDGTNSYDATGRFALLLQFLGAL